MLAAWAVLALLGGGVQAAAADQPGKTGGIKRVSAPNGNEISGLNGFSGHVSASGNLLDRIDRLKRVDEKIFRGPNGQVLRVISLGPKSAPPPLPRAKPERAVLSLGAQSNGPVPVLIKPGLRPLSWPLSGFAVSAGFGVREHPVLGGRRPHLGIDLPAPSGTPVRAAADGRVRIRGRNGGYGRFILLDHGFGLETAYGHLRGYASNLRNGRRVSRGEVIGYVGSHGLSTGPHLHYEVRIDDLAVDPVKYLPAAPRRVRVRY